MKFSSDVDARLAGLFIFLLGLGAGFWFIYTPIYQALSGASYVTYDRGVGVPPIAILIGLFLMIYGQRGYAVFQEQPTGRALLLLALAVLTSVFGCNFGMGAILKALADR
jgi:predicted acyltransferase